MVALARPRAARPLADGLDVAAALGVSLGVMNWAFYQSFARIPLGIAVTIEFLGPLTLAVLLSRRPRDLLWVALAGRRRRPARASSPATSRRRRRCSRWSPAPRGRRTSCSRGHTGRRWPGLDGLAVASVVAMLVITPFAVRAGGAALLDPKVHRARRGGRPAQLGDPLLCRDDRPANHAPRVFSILMSLEPAAAALAGVLLLHELLRPVQLLAIACVVAASIGATRSQPITEPHPD